MTKWVAFLLLLLAVLVYGLSQMRPMPDAEPMETAPAAPRAESPRPDSPPAPPATPAQGVREPRFGLPGQATPAPTPRAASDPFAASDGKAEPVTGSIKATVLSTSSEGPSRTKFAPTTESIYLTATPERLDDEVEVVASYRSLLAEEEEFSPPVASSGPPRRRVFRLTPPPDGWKSGPYQVVLKARATDQVLGIERFEILAESEKLPQSVPAPEYLDLVPDLQAERGKNVFDSTDEEILLRVSAPDLEPGTDIRTVWSAVEVDRLTAGELIAVAHRPAPGPDRDAVFTFQAPPGGFHSGSYKVDVYFDQALAGSHAFFIQPPTRTTSNP